MQDKKSLLTLAELLKSTEGVLFDNKSAYCGFESVSIDSRSVKKGALFVALKGSCNDGHSYIEQAAENGACVILAMYSSVKEFSPLYRALAKKNKCVVLTENTFAALQGAASCYVSKFSDLKKIGITGSSGKTTVKECIAAVLSQSYSVVMNRGNLNSETGLPLSVFNIRADHQAAVFEMGMNRSGEIKELADVLFPQTALITNIGTAHIGILGSKDKIAEEKKQIFSNFTDSCTGFVPSEDPYRNFLMQGGTGSLRVFGIKESGIENIRDLGLRGSELHYKGIKIAFPLCGIHNIKNAAAAICVGEHFGIGAEKIKAGLESLTPLPGRMQILEGDINIIQDSYNANPDSMSAAIDFFCSVHCSGNKVLILGDMFELGEVEHKVHVQVVQKALSCDARLIVFAGEAFAKAFKQQNYTGDKRIILIPDAASVERFMLPLQNAVHKGDLVLIKASRAMALERLVPILRKREEGVL